MDGAWGIQMEERIAAKHEAMLCSVCRRPSAEELPEKPAELPKGSTVPMMLCS